MNYRLLEAFVAVVRHESYTSAAKQLGLPKSTLSRYVTELEQNLGVHLLNRTTRRVSVTSAGTALYERIVPLMSQLENSLAEMPERVGDVSGTLRVTTSVDFGVTVLASLIEEFLRQFPKISVELHVTNSAVDLVKDGFDVAVRMVSRKLMDSTLRVRKVGHVHLYLVTSTKYLEQSGPIRHPRDLEDRRWVRFASMGTVRFDGPSGSVKLLPKGNLVLDDMLAVREAVRHGAGLGFLPSFVLRSTSTTDDELVHVLPKWQTPGTDICVLWPSSHYTPPKVIAFVEFLSSRLKQGGYVD
jgi:DNA-binding transcriptional LysR family regulator